MGWFLGFLLFCGYFCVLVFIFILINLKTFLFILLSALNFFFEKGFIASAFLGLLSWKDNNNPILMGQWSVSWRTPMNVPPVTPNPSESIWDYGAFKGHNIDCEPTVWSPKLIRNKTFPLWNVLGKEWKQLLNENKVHSHRDHIWVRDNSLCKEV